MQAIAQPVQKKAPARGPDSRRRPTFAVYSASPSGSATRGMTSPRERRRGTLSFCRCLPRAWALSSLLVGLGGLGVHHLELHQGESDPALALPAIQLVGRQPLVQAKRHVHHEVEGLHLDPDFEGRE